MIDLTFTDGRRVEIVYPSSWALDQYAWTPDTTIVYDFDEPREDGSGAIHAQLLLSHGTDGVWTMSLHPMSVWSAEEITTAESHVALHTERNGFVTVQTTRPLSHYTPDPDQAPVATDFTGGEAGIYVDDILGLASTGTCVDDPEYPYPLRDEILDNLDVRLVTEGPGG